MKTVRKPTVWLVDDLKSNRDKFKRTHSKHFTVKVFNSPAAVLDRLRTGVTRPDALLCDIYFFAGRQAQTTEKRVMTQARALRKLANQLHAEDHQDGIDLIEQVRLMFGSRLPFPVYAYTSKGPYLLENSGFTRITQCEARWLFKGKYSPTAEYNIINNGITDIVKSSKKVFLVHGRNYAIRSKVKRFLSQQGLTVIVLDEQASQGKTIIEKLEKYGNVGFAIILITADDLGKLKRAARLRNRARQNVILELGFFLGHLGRDRVCLLYEPGVELPSDCDGIVYEPLNKDFWKQRLRVELRKAGLLLRETIHLARK